VVCYCAVVVIGAIVLAMFKARESLWVALLNPLLVATAVFAAAACEKRRE
jgi:hypothetical protein